MKKGKISASMMCADLDKIHYYLKEFKNSNIDYLHIDIMDGEFVPNFAFGTDYVKSLRTISENIPFDYHFLVNNPLEKMKWFDIRKNDNVAIHFESCQNITECINYIKSKNAKAFIAINPETDYMFLNKYLDKIDGILVMMVRPGFAGKPMVLSTINKVKSLKEYLNSINKENIEIEVDGNITIENAKMLYNLGANIFVAGSSSLFMRADTDLKEIICKMKKAIENGNS